jgi:tRNA(Ile)-lysidine synthase
MKKVKKLQDINHPFRNSKQILDSFQNKYIIAGISGGADSLCLLHILHRMNIKTVAVYVNHGLRDEAAQDGLHVRRICNQWNIPFQLVSINVQEFSQENKIPVEEASRILRYQSLFSIADTENADAVAVAHHADDQVETILMHLLRGSGLSGLRGMPEKNEQHAWHSSIPLVRPLLSTWKKDIENYCLENKIESIQDQTNFDTTFFRNRLRHELIPELETYNAGIKQGLLRMGKILQDDFDYLDLLLTEKINELQINVLEYQVTFSRENFLPLHLSMQRMVLRKIISNLCPDLRDVDFDAIERAIDLISAGDSGKQVDIVDDLTLFLDLGRVVMLRKGCQYLNEDIPLYYGRDRLAVHLGEAISLNCCWYFQMELLDWQSKDVLPQDSYSVILDADKCGNSIFLKTMQAGDRFVPCGMNGHSQKVSDLFTNMKISRWVRRNYPIICNENEILWIPGHRISQNAIIDESTRHVLKLTFQKLTN